MRITKVIHFSDPTSDVYQTRDFSVHFLRVSDNTDAFDVWWVGSLCVILAFGWPISRFIRLPLDLTSCYDGEARFTCALEFTSWMDSSSLESRVHWIVPPVWFGAAENHVYIGMYLRLNLGKPDVSFTVEITSGSCLLCCDYSIADIFGFDKSIFAQS